MDEDIQISPLPARDRFLLLRIERDACTRLEYEVSQRRARRDELALQLVNEGYSWRDVASVAGFANTYIAALKRRHNQELTAE